MTTTLTDDPKLAGRVAECVFCKRQAPSAEPFKLFGFEYRGPGSKWATEHCVCGYFEGPHDAEYMRTVSTKPQRTVIEDGRCKAGKFTPRGPMATDSYYCGCRGWD